MVTRASAVCPSTATSCGLGKRERRRAGRREAPDRAGAPREANRGTKCRVKICAKREKKSFFLRGTPPRCSWTTNRRIALILLNASHGSPSVRVSKEVTMLGAERIPVSRDPRSTPSCAMVTRAPPVCPSTATSWGWRERERRRAGRREAPERAGAPQCRRQERSARPPITGKK